jgi:Protein of unknown function (DUF4231)
MQNEEAQADPKYSSKTDFLAQRLKFHIHEYKHKRNRSRWSVNAIKIATIVIGGTTTTLLGLKGYLSPSASDVAGSPVHPDAFNLAALVLSAITTMLTAWESFADYTWKWVRYRATLVNLYTVKDELDFRQAGGEKFDEIATDELFQKLNLALQETNEEWMSKRVRSISVPAKSDNRIVAETI